MLVIVPSFGRIVLLVGHVVNAAVQKHALLGLTPVLPLIPVLSEALIPLPRFLVYVALSGIICG